MPNPNPYLLAADNSPDLLPLLRSDPSLASAQDEHGYSLVHAAASYNHLDLLRALVREFGVDVDLRDEDGETALFVAETVDAARCLVEELGADPTIRGSEGMTAREKIQGEGDFPLVAEYLEKKEGTAGPQGQEAPPPPPLPEGLKFTVGTMDVEKDVPDEVDPEFRRRIQELAERDDFHSAEGQAELRKLVEDAVLDQGISDDRNVRQKNDE
ncbi:hypothetical protein VUR80DRAFT_9765 [Thermomyces stellatus]